MKKKRQKKINILNYILIGVLVLEIIAIFGVNNQIFSGEAVRGISKESVESSSTSPLCNPGDHYCPFECNDWRLDADCGIPQVHNFIETRSPQDFLNSDIIHWDDTSWRTYPPLIDKVNEITAGLSNNLDKATAIANWVKHSKSYSFPSPANEGKTIIEIFNSSTGICMDAAILTTAMFRIAGIPSRAVLPAQHEYAEAYIDGRWIGFDSTFGEGEVFITDPITGLLYTNQLYGKEPYYIGIRSDGSTYNITNITYYKVNLIPTEIYKKINGTVEINWSVAVPPGESIREAYCEARNSLGSAIYYGPSFIIHFNDTIYYYYIYCYLAFLSDPQHTMPHQSLLYAQLNGNYLQIKELLHTDFIQIQANLVSVNSTNFGWGTILIPERSMLVFKNNDSNYSLNYDPQLYLDSTRFRWNLKSDNLNCDYYSCHYVDSNNFSTFIPPPGISGYGEGGMPPDHYNGFVKIMLPEGRYKLTYNLDGYISNGYMIDVGHYFFDVIQNNTKSINPDQILQSPLTKKSIYQLLITALDKSILLCGDTNGDGSVSVSDIVYLINYLYKLGSAPKCSSPYTSCADTNGDGNVSVSDIIYLVAYLYKQGPEPICSYD